MRRMEKFLCLIPKMIFRFFNDDLLGTAAQTTYFFLFALFPFLIFLVTLIGYIPQFATVNDLGILKELIPDTAYSIIDKLWREVLENRSRTVLSVGFFLAIWISSAGVKVLIRGFNRAYDQEETRSFLMVELVAINFTLQLGLVIIIALTLVVFGEMIEQSMKEFFGQAHFLIAIWSNYRILIATLTLIIIFMFLYHSTPNKMLQLREVLPGALWATFGWIATSSGFAVYANNYAQYSIIYGSLASAVILMLWFYLSSIIILLGAEFNAALAFQKQGIEKIKATRY